jgi:hypothetical protein
VAVADFNGDGKPDLAVTTVLSVSVLLGNGDGTFQAGVNYTAGPTPASVAVGDFNGDGKPDLAVPNPGRYNFVIMLLGNGDGTFQEAPNNYPAGSGPVFAAVGDFNGDGKPDLTVANQGGNNVTILLNTTGGSAKAATSTTLASSLNPSTSRQAATLTATVTPSAGSGVPTGTVTFLDGTATIGSATLNGAGKATLTTATLGVGAHTITAVYGGDSGFKGSTSPALMQTVNPAATSTALTSSLNPSTYGQPVTFTATVASAGGVPAGTVTFRDGATTLGVGTLNGSGQAVFETTALSAGVHSVTADYDRSAIFTGSVSPAVSQSVGKVGTTTALSSSPNPSRPSQTVSFVATVTGQYGGPVTGTVTFILHPGEIERGKDREQKRVLGTAPLVNGFATLSLSTLRRGQDKVTAVFGGDTNSNGSTSPAITQKVSGEDRDDDALSHP